MNKKLLLGLFVFTRIIDLFSSFLSTRDLSNETSPLIRTLNLGWTGFIIANVIFILVIGFFLFRISSSKISYLEEQHRHNIVNLRDYYKFILFNLKDNQNKTSLFKILIGEKLNINSFVFFGTYAIVTTFIIIGILATINNLLLYQHDVTFIDEFSPIVITNTLFLISILVFVFSFNWIVRKRYKK
jgi:hypothetical protein